jgi:hypothetical protein
MLVFSFVAAAINMISRLLSNSLWIFPLGCQRCLVANPPGGAAVYPRTSKFKRCL